MSHSINNGLSSLNTRQYLTTNRTQMRDAVERQSSEIQITQSGDDATDTDGLSKPRETAKNTNKEISLESNPTEPVRIRNWDVASEFLRKTQFQILQQANTAMFSQANQKTALQLLQGSGGNALN